MALARRRFCFPMEFVIFALQALSFIVLADAILSWVVRDPESFPRSLTAAIAEPLCRPVRRILDPGRMGGLDLSPLIVIVGLNALSQLLARMGPGAF